MGTTNISTGLQASRIGFLGAGSVVEAILGGILKNSLVPAGQICITNRRNEERLYALCDKYGTQSSTSREELVRQSDLLILAIKPADAEEACLHLRGLVRPDQLIISVVAGVSTDVIQGWLGVECPIIRTMPNTSSAVGLSVTGVAKGRFATEQHLQQALSLFESIGTVYVVLESDLDIITGLSGSGPAYVYYLVEAMEKAGAQAGLSPDIARQLTIETILGAAQMLLHTREEPAILRKKVTSPGGTTQAGIEVLESYHFQEAVVSAVLRAAERAREMGAQYQ